MQTALHQKCYKTYSPAILPRLLLPTLSKSSMPICPKMVTIHGNVNCARHCEGVCDQSNPFLKIFNLDCRVASLLAMTTVNSYQRCVDRTGF